MNFNIRVLLNYIRSKAKNILKVTYFTKKKKNSILGSDIKIKKKINALQHIYTVTVHKVQKSDAYSSLALIQHIWCLYSYFACIDTHYTATHNNILKYVYCVYL